MGGAEEPDSARGGFQRRMLAHYAEETRSGEPARQDSAWERVGDEAPPTLASSSKAGAGIGAGDGFGTPLVRVAASDGTWRCTPSEVSARASSSHAHPHPLLPANEVEEAMRLQSLERFIRRMDAKERTASPSRRARVEAARSGSVCGTGIAARKVLGSATKERMDRVRTQRAAVAAAASSTAASSLRVMAAAVLAARGFGNGDGVLRSEEPGDAGLESASSAATWSAASVTGGDSGGGWGEDVQTRRPRRLPRHSEPASSHSCGGVARGGSRDALVSATDASGRLSLRKHRLSIALLGVDARGTPPQAAPLLHVLAPPAPPLPMDRGWSLGGKVRGAGVYDADTVGLDEGVSQASVGVETASPGAAARRAGGETAGRGVGRGDSANDDVDDDVEYDMDDGRSVLATVREAGPDVMLLSLDERKALFEAAVQEHVAALIGRLFHPTEDGVEPRVTVHVDLG